jgi:ornithine--oxo-acid transaminase
MELVMSNLDLGSILGNHANPGDRYARLLNPRFYKLLRALGFDRTFIRGEGPWLFDEGGERYLDAIAGYAAITIGRGHPVLLDALHQALDSGLPSLVQFEANPLATALAERLLAVTGREGDRVYFTNSGTEGVEAALKFARASTGRSRLVHCHRGFHGLTLGALSLNGNAGLREGFGPLLEDVVEIPFGDAAALEATLREEPAAAFVIESVQGKTLEVADDEWLDEVAALCRRHGTLLVADEVQTGLGRTGAILGTDHAGIRPDIVVLSKALSGGMVPVGAVITSGEIIDDVFESMARSQVHSSTFKENVLAMVAGLASLHILEEERLEQRARELGDLLRSRLEEVAGKTGCIRAVRGRGLMLGIELDIERMAGGITLPFVGRHRTTLVAQAVVRHLLLEHRVLALSTSADSATIKFTPPLVIEAEQVEQLASAVQRTLERLDRTTLGADIHGLAGMTRGLLTP